MIIDINKLNLMIANNCMTVKELSAASGVNDVTLCRIRSNTQKPSLKTIGKIAKALKCKVEDLIKG